MPISIVCGCGKRLQVADAMKGKKVRCPGCSAVLLAAGPAAPAPVPKAATTASAPKPKAAAAPKTVADKADAPKAKKSTGKVLLLLGCGCLGLVGTGIAAVVITIVVAVASHKSSRDKLVGEWILDPAESKRLNMDVPRAYADTRYRFEKDGTALLHCQNKDVPKTWQVIAETTSSGSPKLELLLDSPAGDAPMPSTVFFWSDDRIEITFPINCILRRGAWADAPVVSSTASAPSTPVAPPDPDAQSPEKTKGPGAPRLLNRHHGQIMALTFSPDGKTLASACYDETARLWDVGTGRPKKAIFRTQPGAVMGVAFLGDGQSLVSAGGQNLKEVGTVKRWDAATGKEKATLRTQKDVAHKLAISPDGKLLAWDDRFGIVLWDVERGAVRTTLREAILECRDLAFSRDGKKLAADAGTGNIFVWDVAKPDAPPVRFIAQQPRCLAWNHDGTILAVGGTRTVTLYDPATGMKRKEIAGLPENVNGLAYSPDGKVLAAGSLEWLLCYDPADGHELAKVKSPFSERHFPGCLAFSPDGKILASGSAEIISGTIILWDVGALLKPRP